MGFVGMSHAEEYTSNTYNFSIIQPTIALVHWSGPDPALDDEQSAVEVG